MKNLAAWGLAVLAVGGVWLIYSHRKQPITEAGQIREDFRRWLKPREEVVELARAERLSATAHNFHLKSLPTRYSHLSDGGEIIVEKPKGNTKVFFYTFRGMLSGSHGFLYAADDRPTMYEEPRPVRVERLAPHWYWIMTDG